MLLTTYDMIVFGVTAAITVFLTIVSVYNHAEYDNRPGIYPDDRPGRISLFVLLLAPIFVFLLMHPFPQLKKTISTGEEMERLPLVAASIITGFFGLVRLVLILFHRIRGRFRRWFCAQEFDHPARYDRIVLQENLEVAALGRYGYYGVVLVVLWLSDSHELSSVAEQYSWLFSGISLLLFFIIDDWNIIVAYRMAAGGRMMMSHRFKLIAVETLLFFGTSAWAIVSLKSGLIAFFTILLLSLFVVAMIFTRIGNPRKLPMAPT